MGAVATGLLASMVHIGCKFSLQFVMWRIISVACCVVGGLSQLSINFYLRVLLCGRGGHSPHAYYLAVEHFQGCRLVWVGRDRHMVRQIGM